MKKIVVLGGGFAGIKTVVELQKKLKREVEIVLVDRNPYHCETNRLPEVASGNHPYTRISYNFTDVLDDKMSKLIVDDVTTVDYKNKMVHLKNHADLKYDYLVLGLGFVLGTFGISGVKENTLPMYNTETAQAIRDHIYAKMEDYKKTKDPKDLRIVFCGAGFQAIELAGAIASSRDKYAKIAGVDPDKIEVRMIDGSPRLLPMFDDKQMKYALSLVDEVGIKIIKPARIEKVEADAVYYKMTSEKDEEDPHKIETNTTIWMMGFSGNPVIAASGFKQNRGRITVTEHLTVPEDEAIYALGDVSAVMVPSKKWPWPNTAQLALSMAGYAAKDISARVLGHSRPNPYRYHDLGVDVAIGDTKAAAKALGHNYRGYLASALKKIIDDKSLMETGGIKETLAVGRFDLYH